MNYLKRIYSLKNFVFFLMIFIPLLSFAQTSKQEVIEEFIRRFNNGNDDIVDLCYEENDREKNRNLRNSLGQIRVIRLIQNTGNTLRYEVSIGYTGAAEIKFVFKNFLIKEFSIITSKEKQPRSETDELISKSFDALHAAHTSFDIKKAFEEINKIETLYNSGKSTEDEYFKHWIKFLWAETHALGNNDREALRLLGELKEEKPDYIGESLYRYTFASLHSNLEYIRIAHDPLTLYFALAKPLNDSILHYYNTNKPDELLRFLDIKDSLYLSLSPENRVKVSFAYVKDKYARAAAYSMKENIDAAMSLLMEMKENGWNYAIIYTINDDNFKNLKQVPEYINLVSGTKCNCEEIFDWVVTKFRKSDAGFDYAVDIKGKEAYEKHTAEKQAESKPITLSNDCVKLVNEWLSFFRKSHIGFFPNQPTFSDDINSYDKFAIEKLSNKTMYIKIKSFSGDISQQIIACMIKTNDFVISNTPNLIIDLRGNGGGKLDAWNPLRKYLYSKPVYSFPGNSLTTDLPGLNREDVQKYPESIVILSDHGTGSASERFIIYAKQSNKVKVMGQKTAGAEEVGNCLFTESPDKQFLLRYGTSMNPHAKYTQYLDYGIQPDIFLTEYVDWIDLAQKYLEY